jgi:phosphatidylserine decarboxylase
MIYREGKHWILYPALFSACMSLFRKKKLAIAGLGLSLFNIYFFRNPRREPILNPEYLISPADGKVVECEIKKEPELYPEPLWKVSIFMRLWDVHINRSPVTGKVLKVVYFKGQKLPAFLQDVYAKNEKQVYLIEREDGIPVWVVQIAGVLARRIKGFVLPGDDVVAGDPIGIIKFGSRVDLLFPLENAELCIKEGHRVLAGETVIARLPLKKI